MNTRLSLIIATIALSVGLSTPASAQFLKSLFKGEPVAEREKEERKPVVRQRAAEPAKKKREATEASARDVRITSNDGELRSAVKPQRRGLFAGFSRTDPEIDLLPETRALDAMLDTKSAKKPFSVKPEYEPQSVAFRGYARGTIVIDTGERFLYLVESANQARRYKIAVGREGLAFKGRASVGDKQEWPRWFPTKDMQKREPHKYGRYKDGMDGGPENPLGARAIYLYQGKRDTHVRIHGTNQPQTVGTASSNGCFRMINEHVMDLYRRVNMGAEVVVL